MTEPWRLRCPEGHAAVRMYSDHYYCQSCEGYYHGSPYDPKRTELPVDEQPYKTRDHGARAMIEPVHMAIASTIVYLLGMTAIAIGVML